ncbi:T9SS type A sorting domain-containing protein [Aurantibacter aestuarii]|uniref:Glycosyl hydrolase n=1 Tax=Aurantibacter aestuarii TaxID=1266046 RepID=A0A2T1NCL5_9FLAO|nr:T9SS type A sorting domain-containing protein [Aurantibacter aestuarii]PSG90190.1 glycosyl hydrolase [Aurantibacter aestuarii]
MKKILFFIVFAVVINFAHAQFNEMAPWMIELNEKAKLTNKPLKFQEIVNAFNNYWETRDPNVKGSGYKPFKRWENYWKNFVKPDGTLPNGKELLDQFNQYKALKASQKNSNSSAQLVDVSNWQPVGPFSHINTGSWSSGQGRINAIVKDPLDSNTYYAGAPAGGFWKSTDGGLTWVTSTDDLPQIGVSGIAVDASNTNIIYIATGDDDAGDSFSVGVMKSIDGGLTWNATGLNPNNFPAIDSMNDIYINPSNPNMLWVATNRGVYRSTDAGTSWTVGAGTSNINIRDIKVKPNDPTVIYAASSNRFYRSTNSGSSFTQIFGGLPFNGVSRYVIDVTPSDPNLVYLLSADNSYEFGSIYRSSNSGVNFSVVANQAISGDIFQSTQSWYDLAFAVSDTNPNELYVGVLNIWKGTVQANNQATFTQLNSWSAPFSSAYTHADIHYLRFFNGELLAGTDGGFYKSTNAGSSFTDLTEGMQISQFYRIAVSKQTSTKMVGGLQDNGGHAFNNNTWQNYYGADGMDTAIDPGNSSTYFGFTQNGGGLYISSSAGSAITGSVNSPAGTSGNWITPLKMNSDRELYAGYESLYRLNGSAWTQVSTNFGTRIDHLEIDDINPDNIFIAINNSLRKSTNRGVSFGTVETFTSDITSIEVNNTNNNIIYVTTSGSAGGVFKSNDGGLNFVSISSGLPNVTKNIIKHQPLHSKNPLFLGTSLGVYRYDDDTLVWELFENGLPTVSVTDLEINIFDDNITAATYGRGIWQSAIPIETPTNDIKFVSLSGISTEINCNTNLSPLVEVKNNGANPISSVDITYYIDGVANNYNWSSGTIAVGQTAVITLPNIAFTKGLHTFRVSSTITNDAHLVNNDSEEQLVYANDSGQTNVVNTFETPAEELLVFDEGTSTQYWERGIPTDDILNDAANPTNQVYGTNLTSNYADNVKSYLVSQCFDLTTLSSPVLKFDMAFDLETDWDIVYVEYSIDNGLNWTILGDASDANWYNSNTTQGQNNTCFNCPGSQWTGTDGNLNEYSKSLDAFASATNFMARIVFHSDESVNQEGVIIDNFVITGNTLSTEEFSVDSFSIYPNPSNGLFHIKTSKSMRFNYAIYDVTGKLVLKENEVATKNNKYTINLSNYAQGLYFLNMTSENTTITKKLMLK